MKNTFFPFELKSLYKVAISFLAVLFLVINAGCSSGSDMTAKLEQPASGMLPAGQSIDVYKPIGPAQGGMNNYSDVDPRVDTSKAEAKADRLVNKANSQQKGGVNPLKEVRKELDKKGPQDRAENFSKNLSQSAQKKANQAVNNAQKGIDNVKENTNSFKEDVESVVDKLGKKAQNTADDIKDTAQKTADSVRSNAKYGKS